MAELLGKGPEVDRGIVSGGDPVAGRDAPTMGGRGEEGE